MHLTATNLAHFLMERGYIAPDDAVTGRLAISEASRRNRNFRVMRAAGPGLFVKQARDAQPDAILTLRREAACYVLARDDPTLARLMPTLVSHDANRHVLVMELLERSRSLAERQQEKHEITLAHARALGAGLGGYLGRTDIVAACRELAELFPGQVPVILTLRAGGLAVIERFGTIGPALAALLRQHNDLIDRLDALGADWRFDSLVHGDIKWDNVLVAESEGDAFEFRIVDWEMADIGDAAWDAGAVLQACLLGWIMSMPIASGVPAAAYVGMAAQPLEAVRPVMRAFLDGYAAARGWSAAEHPRERARCLAFAAARLVWTTVERRQHTRDLDPAATALLQVSANILGDPARALADLVDA